MIIESFKFHLRARNLSPRTIKATEDYLRPFLATCDPLEATQRNVEAYLLREGVMAEYVPVAIEMMELARTKLPCGRVSSGHGGDKLNQGHSLTV